MIVIIMNRNILPCMGGVDMALSPDVRPLGSSGICSFHICVPIGAFHFTHNSLIKIEEIWLFSVIGPLTIFEFLINIYIVSRVLDFCNRNTLVLVLCVIEELIYNLQYSALLYYAYFLWPQLFVLKNTHCYLTVVWKIVTCSCVLLMGMFI